MIEKSFEFQVPADSACRAGHMEFEIWNLKLFKLYSHATN